MPKEVFEFSCPCCGKRVELNTRNGKVRAVNIEESRRGKSFEDMVEDQTRESERLASVFDEAAEDHSTHKQRLEDLFDDAKKASAKERQRPPHPFHEE